MMNRLKLFFKSELKVYLKSYFKSLLKILYYLYPAIVLLTMVILFPKITLAGVIRKISLTPEKSMLINLAFGNATALSFQTKPEKLVPGSPEKVQIDFLGKDITISPVAENPGNLLVYTTTGRYVLIFKIVSPEKHDDVVEINQSREPFRRVIQLERDSYHVEKLDLIFVPKHKNLKTNKDSYTVISYGDRVTGKEIISFLESLKHLRCEKCILKINKVNRKLLNESTNEDALLCAPSLPKQILCKSDEYRELKIIRGPL